MFTFTLVINDIISLKTLSWDTHTLLLGVHFLGHFVKSSRGDVDEIYPSALFPLEIDEICHFLLSGFYKISIRVAHFLYPGHQFNQFNPIQIAFARLCRGSMAAKLIGKKEKKKPHFTHEWITGFEPATIRPMSAGLQLLTPDGRWLPSNSPSLYYVRPDDNSRENNS